MKKILIKERRLFARHPLHTKVVFEDEFGEGLIYVYSKDVSFGGLLLESDIPARMGALLFLSFKIPPNKNTVRLTGQVVRTKNGMGIRFLGLPETAKRNLENFCHVI